MSLTLALATKIVQGAMEAARAEGVRPLSFAVCAPDGAVILLVREDGANPMTARIAQAKAATASGFRNTTKTLNEVFGANTAAVVALASVTPGGFAPIGGGVPIYDAAGDFVGSAAAAGDAPPRDEACISAGVLGAGFTVSRTAPAVPERAPWPGAGPAR